MKNIQDFLKSDLGKRCGIAGVFLLLYLFGFLFPVLQSTERSGRILHAKERDLKRIEAIAEELERNKQRGMQKHAGKAEPSGASFATTIETLTRSSGVSPFLQSMKPLPAILDKDFNGEVMEISLNAVPLPVAMNYLYALEHHPFDMSVKRIDIKKRTDGKQGVDILLQLAHLKGGAHE